MAILQLENGTLYTDLNGIARELAPLKIELQPYPIGQSPELVKLLRQDVLNPIEKNKLLEAASCHFEAVKEAKGYQWYDLWTLHPGAPSLFALLTHFDCCHVHTDDEALYVLAGQCIFGFVCPDGSQMELIVQAGEFIHIPGGTEHWFGLTSPLELKAARYFTTVGGWMPRYTDTQIWFRQPVARKYQGDRF